MQIDQAKLAEVMQIELGSGSHKDFSGGACVMEAAAYVIVGVANLCLCGIDIPATAAKYGRKVVASDRDPWVLLVKPINGD